MNNSEIFNPYEGKEVDSIVWPFYRYSALIPEQLGGDMFVWLYLSLVVFNNEGRTLPRDNYDDSGKMDVQKILTDKFGNVIDGQTLEKIINNAERDFVETIKTQDGKKTKILKAETFSFIDTYENLFSDKLDVKYIYQDAITGEVLPFFGDTSFIEDSQDKNSVIKVREGVKEPTKKAVKKAYEQYTKIKKFNSNPAEVEVELIDEFYDEDEQTFIEDSEFETAEEKEEKQEIQNLKKYNVIFLKDKKAEFDLDVNVYVEDNELVLKSPFGINTNQWINKCLKKGRNVSESLDLKMKELESIFLIEEKRIDNYIEGHKNDFASSLFILQTLYRMIDSLQDNRIREYVVKLDQKFQEQDELFYFYCGKFLERLLKKIQYTNKSNALQRQQTTQEMFYRELDNKFAYKNIKYEFLKSANIYHDWARKYTKRDGTEFASFKADLTDILLRTDLINSPLMYPTFIDDIFSLYSLRSAVDHDDDSSVNMNISKEKAEKLTKIVKVLFELI